MEDMTITALSASMLDENLTALEAEKSKGWNINQPMPYTEYDIEPAITFALTHKKLKVVAWLVNHKAKLNAAKYPAIVDAVLCGQITLQLLLDHGANINSVDPLGRNAVTMALYHNQLALIPFLVAHGFDLSKDGRSLRQAVFARQFKAIQLLLDLGVNVNFHQPDQVFPHNPSAVHVAASHKNDLKTVTLLVERGADITVKDQYGDRPFTAAMQSKEQVTIEYLRALEPPEWHDETSYLNTLAPYQLPESLLAICKSKHRKIKINTHKDYGVRFIVLHPVLMLKATTFRKKVVVEFVAETDNYESFLVWYPAKQCLAYLDIEHGEFKALGRWEAFLADPGQFFERYLSDFF